MMEKLPILKPFGRVVIIGGGGAGMAAACSRRKRGGCRIFEKRHTPGGNASSAGGIFAAESPAQERKIDARRDDLFKIAMNHSHWKINPRIVRAFVDKSGDTIRWLEEKGVKFEASPFLSQSSSQDFSFIRRAWCWDC